LIKVFKNGTDITQYVERDSISIDDTLNNQANTASFVVNAYSVSEGNEIEIWEGFFLRQDSAISTNILYVNDTFAYTSKFRVNDIIYLDINNTHVKAVISAIDTSLNTITIATSLSAGLSAGVACGRKIFAGMVLENPDEELGNSGTFRYQVNVSDYSRRFDAKNVVAVYEDMYSREVIGRIIYKYVANDSEVTLDNFESAWTANNNFDYWLWRFDEGSGEEVLDDVESHVGHLTNDGITYETGHDGSHYCLDMDATDERVWLEEYSDMRLTKGTVAFWIYRRDVQSGFNYIVDFGDWKIAHSFGTDRKLWVWLNGSTTQGWYDSTSSLADDTWYHVAITFDDDSIKFYINGVLDREYDNYTGTLLASDSYSTAPDIGSRWSEYFDGKIDELFIADDVLSKTQIGLVKDDEWTGESVALSMTDDTTDLIDGNKSQQTGTSGAGLAIWYKTITAVDCSDIDAYRLWFKIGKGYGNKITNITYKIGSSNTDYYSGSAGMIGLGEDDCWNYWTFKLADCDVNGTPDLSGITYLEIQVLCTQEIPTGNIHFDISKGTEDGFTLNNCERGTNLFERVPSNFRKPTVLVEELAKSQQMFWFVDYDRDLHFFEYYDELSPFNLTDTSVNYSNLGITADISQLKNRQAVVGDETPATELYTQYILCNGEAESWNIDYRFNTLSVYVDVGAGYVLKTDGAENLVDPADYDFITNFSEKVLKLGSIVKPSSGTKIKLTYYPYYPIQYRYTDPTSPALVATLLGHGDGIFDGALIEDKTISTWADARARAKAEVDAYKNAIITADFETEIDGLESGQVIHIEDSSRSIDDDFLIQKVGRKSRDNDRWLYRISCGSSFFGLIEFFQLLLKKTGKINTTANDVVRISVNQDETITLTDASTQDINADEYTVGSKFKKVFLFEYEAGNRTTSGVITSGTKNSGWKVKFTGQGAGALATFDASSNYNTGKSLSVTTDTDSIAGGNVRLRSRLVVSPGTQYNAYAFVEIPTTMTGVHLDGGGEILVKEYADNNEDSSSLASHTICTSLISKQDYAKHTLSNFTTNAGTHYIDIEVTVRYAIGTINVGKIVLQDTTTDSETNPAIVGYSMLA